MWSLFLGPPGPCHRLISKQLTPTFKLLLVPTISAASQPQRRRSKPLQNNDVSAQQVGDLGHTLLTALQSNPGPTNPIPKPQEGEGAQISGSDVLWALQRATARKKKKKQQRREPSSVSNRREESAEDYSNVRPLRTKSEWGTKLDELEKCLQELLENHLSSGL